MSIVNPLTGRRIKIGTTTYRKLVKQGVVRLDDENRHKQEPPISQSAKQEKPMKSSRAEKKQRTTAKAETKEQKSSRPPKKKAEQKSGRTGKAERKEHKIPTNRSCLPFQIIVRDGRRYRRCPHGYKIDACGCKPTLANVLPFKPISTQAGVPAEQRDSWKQNWVKSIAAAHEVTITPSEERFLERELPHALSEISNDKHVMKPILQTLSKVKSETESWFAWIKKGVLSVYNKLWSALEFIWNRPEIVLIVSLVLLFVKRWLCSQWKKTKPVVYVLDDSVPAMIVGMLTNASERLVNFIYNAYYAVDLCWTFLSEYGGWTVIVLAVFGKKILEWILAKVLNALLTLVTKIVTEKQWFKGAALAGSLVALVVMFYDDCARNLDFQVLESSDPKIGLERQKVKNLVRNFSDYQKDAHLHQSNANKGEISTAALGKANALSALTTAKDKVTEDQKAVDFMMDRLRGKHRNRFLPHYAMTHPGDLPKGAKTLTLENHKTSVLPVGPTLETFRPNTEYKARVLFPVRDERAQKIATELASLPGQPLGLNGPALNVSDATLSKLRRRVREIPLEDRTRFEQRAQLAAWLELHERHPPTWSDLLKTYGREETGYELAAMA